MNAPRIPLLRLLLTRILLILPMMLLGLRNHNAWLADPHILCGKLLINHHSIDLLMPFELTRLFFLMF